MIPLYQSKLTPEEYESYVKHGAAMYLASASMQFPALKKEAQALSNATASLSTLGDYSTKLLLTLSVVTGVPAGIMMHVVGKRIGEKRLQDKEIINETKYYGNAAKSLEAEMARQGMKVAQSVLPEAGEGFIPGKVQKFKAIKQKTSYLAKAAPAAKKPAVKAAEALHALKQAQDSEIETGDEDNQPEKMPAMPIPEPSGLLAAVGEQPKDPQQQQAMPQGPTPNNEVVNKSNITAQGDTCRRQHTRSIMNKEYTQGFIDKCAEAGVDPEQLVKTALNIGTVLRAAPKIMSRRMGTTNALLAAENAGTVPWEIVQRQGIKPLRRFGAALEHDMYYPKGKLPAGSSFSRADEGNMIDLAYNAKVGDLEKLKQIAGRMNIDPQLKLKT